MMTKDSATVEQFMEWVGDAKVMIAINSYEVCEKIMGVEIPFAEVHYDKNKKEIIFSSKDKASLMIRKALKKEGLYVNKFQNAYGVEVYHVVNENNVIPQH